MLQPCSDATNGGVAREGHWPAGMLKLVRSSSPPRDLDLEEKQPALCFINGRGTQFRAIHRRPVHAGVIGSMFLVRDTHALGPWRDNKCLADLDCSQLTTAYNLESESGLFRRLREMHTSMICVQCHTDNLISWEIEVELAIGKRWARVVLRGEKQLIKQLFTIRSPWKRRRTEAEEDLEALLQSFMSGGASKAECCNCPLVTHRPPETHRARVTPYWNW